ncbi:MAG: hypothetical protein EBU31_09720, partial [Proteobacteria bacterium]|nr:hypothetical protein [Pseudomonadota bacterium]
MARPASAPRPQRLRRAEVREVERSVGVDHAHEPNTREIKALGDHLRSHQELHLAATEAAECVVEVGGIVHAVGIDAEHGLSGHERRMEPRELLLHALHTQAEHRDLLAAARAVARQALLALAVVATHVLRGCTSVGRGKLVADHPGIAPIAAHHPAAAMVR